MAEVITIPYKPRELQQTVHDSLKRFNVLVCHRRFGKTVLCINELVKRALTCAHKDPRYAYIAPLYRQAKQVAWDYLKLYTEPLPHRKVNESELRVDLPGGSRIQLFGADNPDALRGMYLDGVVLDEYAQMPPRLWGEVIRPLLADREGWAVFIGTPMGHNQFWEIWQEARKRKDWFAAMYKASETGILSGPEIRDLKSTLQPEEYEQELECSFTAAVKGAYYGRLMAQVDEEKRITRVPHDPVAPVWTWWDLGIGDPTAIWFVQHIGREIRVIDFYEASGVGLAHYAKVLQEKADARGFLYAGHVGPHDIEHKELGTGLTRRDTAKSLGIRFDVVPQHKREDGIQAVRDILPRCWFDAEKCHRGIEALRLYRTEWDDQRNVFKLNPLHDWTSHPADAFRYGAMHKPSDRERFTQAIKYPQQNIV